MKTLALIIALAVITIKIIDVAVPRAIPQTPRVDTVRVVTTVYDTVTVVSKAADTVWIRVKQVGPLTERDVVRLACGRMGLTYGDARDQFEFNGYGMMFCPKGVDER